MTPNDIEVLIHYYSTNTDHPRIKSPAVDATVRHFISTGLLDRGGKDITPKGKAHINQLCNTAFPSPGWIDSDGHLIKG